MNCLQSQIKVEILSFPVLLN